MKKGLKVSLMLDSGVFSAWNRGGTLDLKRYIAFIKEHEEYLASYVAMDVIPGVFGRKRTTQEGKDAGIGSYKNHQKMKDAGLSPIPVFHQGDGWNWLEKMLNEGEPYIGVSSAKDIWVTGQRQWLDEVFSLLTDSTGRPLVRTHGFGITRPSFMFRYPWYSIDSTTWSLSAGFGKIFCPVYVDGKPDYLLPPINVIMSGILQKSPSTQKRQFEAMGPARQEAVRRFLEEEVGIKIFEARYGTTLRRRALLLYYLRLCEHLRDIRFEHRHELVVHQLHIDRSAFKAQKPWNLRLMFATSLSREWAHLMNDVGAKNRLLSYYELKDKPPEVLQEYVTRGILGSYVKKPPPVRWTAESYLNYRRLKLARRVEAYHAEDGTSGEADSGQPSTG